MPPSNAGALYGEEVDGGDAAAVGRRGEETVLLPLIQVARRGHVDRRVEWKGGFGERAGDRKSKAIGGEKRGLGSEGGGALGGKMTNKRGADMERIIAKPEGVTGNCNL